MTDGMRDGLPYRPTMTVKGGVKRDVIDRLNGCRVALDAMHKCCDPDRNQTNILAIQQIDAALKDAIKVAEEERRRMTE